MTALSLSPSRRGRRPTRNVMLLTVVVWLPMLAWYAAFRPGLMSADSLEIYRQAVHGGWIDIQPPAYTAAMWISYKVLGSPSLLTLAQTLFLAAGIAAVAAALVRIGARRNVVLAVTGVVAILPQVGAFSISLWKDIPYTAAFLFLGARIVDLVRARLTDDDVLLRRVIWSIALWASIAVVLRQNGVLMVVGMMAVLVIVIRPARKQLLIAAVIPLIVLGTMKVVVYRVLDVTPSGSQPALAGFLHDIAASANADPGSFDQSDRALMETAAPFEVWRQTFAQTQCASANWQWDPRFHWAAIDGESSDFVSLWTRVAEEHPLLVARNRLCVGGIAFAPYTDRGVLYTVSRGIDDNPLGLRTAPVVSSFTSPARDVLDTLDEPGWQGIAWRAPGWIYLSYLAIGVAALRSRRWILLLPALPLLMLQLSVFPVNPSQDARYMFPGLILAVLLLPLASRRPQPNRPNTEVDRAGEGEPQPTEPERADELVST